jgi:hypothetical protein
MKFISKLNFNWMDGKTDIEYRPPTIAESSLEILINNWRLWCYSECISTPGKLEKYACPRWESNLRPLEY